MKDLFATIKAVIVILLLSIRDCLNLSFSLHLFAQDQSAPPQSLLLLAFPALSSLKPWTATLMEPTVALLTVVAAGVTLTELVFSTQLLDLEFGNH